MWLEVSDCVSLTFFLNTLEIIIFIYFALHSKSTEDFILLSCRITTQEISVLTKIEIHWSYTKGITEHLKIDPHLT